MDWFIRACKPAPLWSSVSLHCQIPCVTGMRNAITETQVSSHKTNDDMQQRLLSVESSSSNCSCHNSIKETTLTQQLPREANPKKRSFTATREKSQPTKPNKNTSATTNELPMDSKKHLDEMLRFARPTRQVLEELAVACAKDSNPDNTFQYAFALSKSTEKSELRYAVALLDGLIADGYGYEMDCMYAAATALYLLGDYEESRAWCENILRSNPEMTIATELHRASVKSMEQRDAERVKQAAIGGTAAVAVLGVAAGVASIIIANQH